MSEETAARPTLHADVGEGRAPVLDLDAARAIADASEAAGFAPPLAVQEALAAGRAAVRDAKKAPRQPTPPPAGDPPQE